MSADIAANFTAVLVVIWFMGVAQIGVTGWWLVKVGEAADKRHKEVLEAIRARNEAP